MYIIYTWACILYILGQYLGGAWAVLRRCKNIQKEVHLLFILLCLVLHTNRIWTCLLYANIVHAVKNCYKRKIDSGVFGGVFCM